MLGLLPVVFAMLMIGVLTSNAEGRAKARTWLKPFERRLMVVTLVLWVGMAASYFQGN